MYTVLDKLHAYGILYVLHPIAMAVSWCPRQMQNTGMIGTRDFWPRFASEGL